MNVEGFYFGFSRYNPANIALLIPYEKNDGYVFHWYEFKSIKHIFNTNYTKLVVKPKLLKKTIEDKKEIHVDVELEEGVEV
jgi:hypothetical protein